MIPASFWFVFKALLSGLVIATISVLAKKSPKWAALLTALPLMTYLSLIWIYLEQKNTKNLAPYVLDVCLWLLPGIPFFLTAYILFKRDVNFYLTMILSTLALALGVFLFEKMGWLR